MKINNLREINKGSLVAKFDVEFKHPELGVITLKDCTQFCVNDKRWIALPQRDYLDTKENKRKYVSLINIENKEMFDKAVLGLLKVLKPPQIQSETAQNDPVIDF